MRKPIFKLTVMNETDKLLYQYCKIDKYFYDMIINSQLWFSKLSAFNDPFDANIPWDLVHTYKEILKMNNGALDMINSADLSPSYFMKSFNECREKISVACFSESKDNLLMWAHYADKHKGVLLVFDLEILKSIFKKIIKIDYTKQLPDFNFSDNPSDIFKKYIDKKSENWKLEEEVRIIENNEGNYRFPISALKEIRFGLRCPKEQITTIINLVKNLGYSHIELNQACPDKNVYGLITKEFLLDLKDYDHEFNGDSK